MAKKSIAQRTKTGQYNEYRKLSKAEAARIGVPYSAHRRVLIGIRVTKRTPTITERDWRTRRTAKVHNLSPEAYTTVRKVEAGKGFLRVQRGSKKTPVFDSMKALEEWMDQYKRHIKDWRAQIVYVGKLPWAVNVRKAL